LSALGGAVVRARQSSRSATPPASVGRRGDRDAPALTGTVIKRSHLQKSSRGSPHIIDAQAAPFIG